MSKRALPVIIGVVAVAVIALVYNIVRTVNGGTAAPTPVGKPQVNDARTRALYMRTHGGASMPGGTPSSTPGQTPGGP